MISKLKQLDYKPIQEFENPNLRHNLNNLIARRMRPFQSEFYVKILDQSIRYEMDDGEFFENRVSLTCFFLINTVDNTLYDYFSVVSYPFDLRTEEDFGLLQNLFTIFRTDVSIILKEGNIYEEREEGEGQA